ncbi:GDSL family lipase [Rufibacter immobilis]|uniref:GDSL family lipase n=1 Tax=Rufibacter immobilis TaxID=1348778 RepID=A0A3M9MWR9_9BACT|nr:GDSL-type esterase/lipase family protein [Rufibacter immobilis]RNI29930.1 GDSL family lipase [Rufibacter immobilis]
MIKSIMMGLLLAAFLDPGTAVAQEAARIDSSYANSHYRMRLDFFRQMPNRKKEIVFMGNSITEAGEWQELVPGKNVVNRGISGDVTWGVLARLDEVLESKPAKVFLLIGVNDLKRGLDPAIIANNHRRILQRIKAESPKTKVYLQSVLPVNEGLLSSAYQHVTLARISALNQELKSLAQQQGVPFLNLHPALADVQGQLDKELTTDGIHLKLVAYIKWVNQLKQAKVL